MRQVMFLAVAASLFSWKPALAQGSNPDAYCVFERFTPHNPYNEVANRNDWLRVARCREDPGSPVTPFVLWPGQQPANMTLAMAEALHDVILVTDSGGFHRKCCGLYTSWKRSDNGETGVVHNGVAGSPWQANSRPMCCEDAALAGDPANPSPHDCRSFRLFTAGGSLVAVTSKGVVSLTGTALYIVPPAPYGPILVPAASAGSATPGGNASSADAYCVFERFTSHNPYNEVASRDDWLKVSRCRENPGTAVTPFVLWPGQQPANMTLAMAEALYDDILVTDSGGFHRKCCGLYTSWTRADTGQTGVVHNGSMGSPWRVNTPRPMCCEDAALAGDPGNPGPHDCRAFHLFAGGGSLAALTSQGMKALGPTITIVPPAPYTPITLPSASAGASATTAPTPKQDCGVCAREKCPSCRNVMMLLCVPSESPGVDTAACAECMKRNGCQ